MHISDHADLEQADGLLILVLDGDQERLVHLEVLDQHRIDLPEDLETLSGVMSPTRRTHKQLALKEFLDVLKELRLQSFV